MKTLSSILILALCSWLKPAALGAVLGSNDIAAVHSQGSNSLTSFRALVTPTNYQLMGFHSSDEILQATNGKPLLIYTVPLDQLRDYVPGLEFNVLLRPDPVSVPAPQVIVPIMVGTNVRSSFTLRRQGPAEAPVWVTAGWGQPKLIRELMATYRAIPPDEVKPDTLPFVVEVPVIDIWLIGYFNRKEHMVLRSTVDLRLGPITILRNELVTEAAMQRLSAAAQRYNGLPN